jgi:hypothetical protein
MDGVRAMFRAVIQRAMHDACGAVVVAPTAVQQMKFAKQAWNFLYSNEKEHRDERWYVCMLAGVDPEMLESRMKVAAIPEPTYETLKNAWTQLELAYWRLGGQKGEQPKPRPENVKGERVHGARGQRGYRVVTRAPSRHLSGGDRRDAGNRPATLLFGHKPGVPARPKFAGTAMFGAAASARQMRFAF